MTFSSQVKDELGEYIPDTRHCAIAELTAFFIISGKIIRTKMGRAELVLATEKPRVARKYFTLLRKTFNICSDVCIRESRTRMYYIVVRDYEDVKMLMGAMKLSENFKEQISMITGKLCCARSFLRGVFLCVGSVTDPEKAYHLEFVCPTQEMAETICSIVTSFEQLGQIDAKIIKRKSSFVIYIKDGSQISLLLNIIEAHKALMNMENQFIFKEMRNNVNRLVNCETANINKTVNAASKQIEDIEFIRSCGEFEGLSDNLKQTALLRVENPEATLTELGLMHMPSVGKSGVNHRLKKLCELADSLRA